MGIALQDDLPTYLVRCQDERACAVGFPCPVIAIPLDVLSINDTGRVTREFGQDLGLGSVASELACAVLYDPQARHILCRST